MKFFLRLSFVITHLFFVICAAHAATITGNLTDISIQALDTKLTFAPTNDVLVNSAGLSAGPPMTIHALNGAFSLALDAGDYTVSLPLIAWRRPFRISVPETSGTINITNLLAAPQTYTYTNNLNYALKTQADDATAGFLDEKLIAGAGLTKTLSTNSGAVTVTLSSSAAGPLHVNTSAVTLTSAAGETTLLDGSVTIPAGTLTAGQVIAVEAFGSYGDPDNNNPATIFSLKLGGATVLTETKTVVDGNWHLRILVTVRSSGATGAIAGAMFVKADKAAAEQFNCDTQTATLDTTTDIDLSLTASIDNVTSTETITCEQLVVTLQ